MKVSAVIFDLNGTVLEDEGIYGRAFNTVLESLGIKSGVDIPHTRGIGVKENWPILRKKYGIKTDKTDDLLAVETQQAYLKEISEISIRAGFDEFAQGLKDSGIKIALATSNTWEVTTRVLEVVELTDFFDVVTTEEEVAHNKPEPDLFILSADKLGVERYECLVIEDAASGVTAAQRAGMKVVAIIDEEARAKEVGKADLVIEGFSEITPQAIDSL